MVKTKKQALTLIMTIVATFATLLFANKLHINSFWLNPVLIFTIMSVKSKNDMQKGLGISAFLIYTISMFLRLTYVGFLSAVVNLSIISAIIYVYGNANMSENEKPIPGRFKAVILGVVALILSMIPYSILDLIWQSTILEISGKTAILYGLTLILEYIARQAEKEADYVLQIQASHPKKHRNHSLTIQFLAIWLLILNMTILGYITNTAVKGYHLIFTVEIVTMIITFFIKPHNENDVMNTVYTWLRPFQSLALFVLLVVHNQPSIWNITYLVILALVYTLCMMRKIGTKLGLFVSACALFLPVFGMVSNPYNWTSQSKPTVMDVLFAKDKVSIQNITPHELIDNNGKVLDQLRKENKNEMLRKFVDNFNKKNYYTTIKVDNDQYNYIFYHANLTDEYGEINEDSPHQTLTFSVHVKEQKNNEAELINPEPLFNSIESEGIYDDGPNETKGYGKLLSVLNNDGAITEGDLDDGYYGIRYRVYDQYGQMIKQKTINIKVTRGKLTMDDTL